VEDPQEERWETIPVVSQAMGMVCVQADCTVDDALVLIRERAMVSRSTVPEIAQAVIDRSISFGE